MGKVDSHRIEGCSRGVKAQRFKNRLGDRKADPACRQGQNLGGDEIYFSIPLDREIENGKETVEKGDIGYWPPGRALCLFLVKRS